MKLLLLLTPILSIQAFHTPPPLIARPASLSRRSTPIKQSVVLRMSDESTTVNGSQSQQQGGTATIPNEIFNLVKSIVGAGVLSLPAGTLFVMDGLRDDARR